jgi:hypothetical protein
MPTVRMFYQEVMMRYDVCFLLDSKLVGTHWEFLEPEKIIAILEAANSSDRDIQEVRARLKERRPGSIDVTLTQQQFDRLRTRRPRQQRK